MMTMTVMITISVADDADEDETVVILMCQPLHKIAAGSQRVVTQGRIKRKNQSADALETAHLREAAATATPKKILGRRPPT